MLLLPLFKVSSGTFFLLLFPLFFFFSCTSLTVSILLSLTKFWRNRRGWTLYCIIIDYVRIQTSCEDMAFKSLHTCPYPFNEKLLPSILRTHTWVSFLSFYILIWRIRNSNSCDRKISNKFGVKWAESLKLNFQEMGRYLAAQFLTFLIISFQSLILVS